MVFVAIGLTLLQLSPQAHANAAEFFQPPPNSREQLRGKSIHCGDIEFHFAKNGSAKAISTVPTRKISSSKSASATGARTLYQFTPNSILFHRNNIELQMGNDAYQLRYKFGNYHYQDQQCTLQ